MFQDKARDFGVKPVTVPIETGKDDGSVEFAGLPVRRLLARAGECGENRNGCECGQTFDLHCFSPKKLLLTAVYRLEVIELQTIFYNSRHANWRRIA